MDEVFGKDTVNPVSARDQVRSYDRIIGTHKLDTASFPGRGRVI
jgi:hypothetical protein